MRRRSLWLTLLVPLLGACGRPDTRALQRLACEQAAASLDMQSVSQLDALRKALGVAPGVDPIQRCRALGARMDPATGSGGTSAPGESEQAGEKEEN